MRHCTPILITAVATATLLAAASEARADRRGQRSYNTDKQFGLGLIVGAPTGLTGKYMMDGGRMAIAFAIGEDHFNDHYDDFYDDDELAVHVDVVWHPIALVTNRTLSLPLYVGVGARLADHDDYCHRHDGVTHCHDDDAHLGVRVPFGLSMDFRSAPVDVFFELVPTVDLFDNHAHHDNLYITGSLGARFWF